VLDLYMTMTMMIPHRLPPGQDMGFTPLYVAVASGANQCIPLLEEAGGLYEVPKKPTPGFRTCLDVFPPQGLLTASQEKAKNLERRPYCGQY
jgi:hypothetical protein